MKKLKLLRGQRYKEFHVIDEESLWCDFNNRDELHLFYVDNIRLEIIYCNLFYQDGKKIENCINFPFEKEICCPADVGSSHIIARMGKNIFYNYVDAVNKLNELIEDKIEEIKEGKIVTEFLRDK